MKTDELPQGMRGIPLRRLTRKRHADWLSPPKTCPCCGGGVRLVSNAEIYKRPYGPWPYAYKCDSCGAYTGVHPESIFPVGTMADRTLIEARRRVHDALNAMRDYWRLTDREAIERLARLLDIPVAAGRIATFDLQRCHCAIAVIAQDTGPVAASRISETHRAAA